MTTIDGEQLVALVAVATLPLAALAAIFVSGTAAAAVAVVGWLFLVPVLAILYEDGEFDLETLFDRDDAEESARQDPLDTLRDRYARGELSDEEFEMRLERLLETEGIEIPESASGNSAPDRETELTR